MISYELAKNLKNAGFPWRKNHPQLLRDEYKDRCSLCGNGSMGMCCVCIIQTQTTLSELIEAVGFCFATLQKEHNNRTPEGYLKFSGWKALAIDATCSWVGKGLTPEIAVAELWLNIKNNVFEYQESPIEVIKFIEPVYGIHPEDTKKCVNSGHTIKMGSSSCLCGNPELK